MKSHADSERREMTSTYRQKSAVVVGGGISGLTAGFRLHQRGYAVTVLERSAEVGGKMSSLNVNGFTVNRAANILPSSYANLRRLINDVGLGSTVSDVTGMLAIPRDGELKHIRSTGTAMVIDGARTDLLSVKARLKARNLVIDGIRMKKYLSYENLGASAPFDVESAAEYCDRRLTPELEEFLVNPMLRALYCNETDRLSIVDFFFAAVNFIGSGFLRYQGGIGFLTGALAKCLDVRYHAEVARVEERDDDVAITYSLDGSEQSITADACVIATDAKTVPGLFDQLDPRQREIITDHFEYATVYAGHFALKSRPDESAMVIPVPASLEKGLCAVVLPHNYSDAAPAGKGLASTYWLEDWSRAREHVSDEALATEMLRGIDKVLPGTSNNVEFSRIDRWQPATIRSFPGMYSYVGEFVRRIDRGSRVQLAGDYLSASSTNGCASSAEAAAARVIAVVG